MSEDGEPIIVCDYDVQDGEGVRLSIFKPRPYDAAGDEWVCRIKLDGALERDHLAHGVNALQALLLGQQLAAIDLYTSKLYRDGRLGLFGEFCGNLLLPRPAILDD